MCSSKVINKMYLVQWLAIPYIPLYLSKIHSLTHMENKTSTAFLALIRSYRPLIFQQNPFPNPLLSDPHRHTPAPTT